MGTTGLLLVHGIGSQSRASVLTTACDELVGWLRDRYGDADVTYGPTQLRLGEDDSSGPPTARIEVRDRASFVVAESRWAESFIAPSYGKITGWLLVAVIRATRHEVGNLLGQLTAPDPPDPGGPFAPGRPYPPSRAARILRAFWLLAALPLALALILATAVLRIFPPARDVATTIQRVLSGTIGDAYVFCQNLTGRAAIVQQVRRDIEWLSESGIDRIVVAAHSQGAAVTHEALSSCTAGHDPTQTCGRCATTVELLTYGSGLDKLTALSTRSKGSPLGLVATVGAGLSAGSSLVALGVGVGHVLGRIDEQSAQAVALLIAGASVVLGGVVLVVWAGALRTRLGRLPWRRVFLVVLVVLVVLGCVGLTYVSPLATVLTATAVAVSLAIGFGCLRREARPHGRPRRAATWIDVKASADPVASSALETDPGCTDLVIHNRRSVALDHTTYWQNWAEFVPAVLNVLAAGDGPDLGVPRAWLARERSRRFEVTWVLSGARIFMTAAFGALLVAVITDLPAVGGWLVDRYADAVAPFGGNDIDVDSQLAQIAVAVAALAIVSALAYMVFAAWWKRWQRLRRHRRVGDLARLAETSKVSWDDWRALARCERHEAGRSEWGWLAIRCGPPGPQGFERIWVADAGEGTAATGPDKLVSVSAPLRGKGWVHLQITEVGTTAYYDVGSSRARTFLLLVSADSDHR